MVVNVLIDVKILKIDQASAHDVDALIGPDGWRKQGGGRQP